MQIGNNYIFKKMTKDGTLIQTEAATNTGVGIKTAILVGITFLATIFGIKFIDPYSASAIFIYIAVAIVNFVLHLIIVFNPSSARILSIPYAIMEGLMLGVINGILYLAFGDVGFAISGVALVTTVAIFLGATILYSAGIIKVSSRFRSFMFTFVLGIVLASIGILIFTLIAPTAVNTFLSSSTGWGIMVAVGILMVVVASIYVVFSIDNAARIVDSGADKKYEWLAAYGILINVIWLYLEILRVIILILNKRE